MNDEKIITGSWLPVFPGFYGTLMEDILDRSFDYELEYIKDMDLPKKLKAAMTEHFYESNAYYSAFKDAQQDIAEQCVRTIEQFLKENKFIEAAKFDELVSPREYNFANDSINVTYTFSAENIQNIRHFISEHFEAWKEYLKGTYTSYDGFMSHHSNDSGAEEWFVDSALNDRHNAGSILEFICGENEINTETLYYGCESVSSVDLTALQKECIEQGWYVPDTRWNRLKGRLPKFEGYRLKKMKGSKQFVLDTPKQRYVFAISKEKEINDIFVFKRIFKVFIFARLKDEKKKDS